MTSSSSPAGRKVRIVVVGAGPGGLCMGVKLKAAGFEDFLILEREDGVGGTWRRNRYPGAACDVPSALYSFSFEIKTDWSRPYGTQPEILAYLEHIAESYGLLPHCRFGAEVRGAAWDEASTRWKVELRSGEVLDADVVVSALGMFNEVAIPDIEGLDSFRGTMFHSAQWDWNHDLTGEAVGVIGSAASAVQFVPEVAEVAGRLHLFQRTANWVVPKADTPYTDEQLAAFRADPSLVRAIREETFRVLDAVITFSNPEILAQAEGAVLAALEAVEDPAVREQLRPVHPYGCKRPLLSNDFYPTFNRPNVELVVEPIAEVTAHAIVTADGRERPVDTIVLATGFQTTRYLSAIDVVGRGGRHIDDAWRDGACAYLGVTTSGFPNLFMLYGPNTNNGSILTMIEYQTDYVIGWLTRMVGEGLAWIDVRPEPMERYNDELQEGIAGVTVWHAGCNGYYRTPTGRVVTQWPYSMSEFGARVAKPDEDAYEVAALSPR
jgi:cation diffusion facilitator CzcD-associated flavoprotein CzcO